MEPKKENRADSPGSYSVELDAVTSERGAASASMTRGPFWPRTTATLAPA
jgi:hypothetical protein